MVYSAPPARKRTCGPSTRTTPSIAIRSPLRRTSALVWIVRAGMRSNVVMKLLAFSMPNWSYLAINFLYQFGLALWIGGSIALGALAAPVLFKALPRAEAGAIFGPTLRRFSRVRVVAVLLIISGAAAKYIGWE